MPRYEILRIDPNIDPENPVPTGEVYDSDIAYGDDWAGLTPEEYCTRREEDDGFEYSYEEVPEESPPPEEE